MRQKVWHVWWGLLAWLERNTKLLQRYEANLSVRVDNAPWREEEWRVKVIAVAMMPPQLTCITCHFRQPPSTLKANLMQPTTTEGSKGTPA